MPSPVSRTHTAAPPSFVARASRLTVPPGGVNLMALPIRLPKTLRSLAGSPLTVGRSGSIWLSRLNLDLEGGRLEGGQRHLQDLVELDLAGIERVLAALHLGDVEDVVDDGEEMRGGVANEIGVFDDLAVLQAPLLMLAEQLGKADHRVERRPELVAHVGDEFGFDLARQLGLDARRVLGEPSLVPQHRLGEQRRVLGHQRALLARPCCPAQHDPNRRSHSTLAGKTRSESIT